MIQNISNSFKNVYESKHSLADDYIEDMRIRLIGCGVYNTTADSIENFLLPAFMIVSYKQGSVRIQHREETFTLQPGAFYVFRPYEVYNGKRLGDESLIFSYLQFDITPFMERYAFDSVSFLILKNIIHNERYHRFGQMLDELASSDLQRDGIAALLRQLAKYVVAQILFDQSNQEDFSNCMAVSRESKLINRTFQYVSKHMADPIAIGDILQELAVNKTNLERSFRKVLNYTPQRAILRFKIERSMEMLQHGESIKTIAKDLGFNSLYHFSNTFKRITGIRPTEYLKRKR